MWRICLFAGQHLHPDCGKSISLGLRYCADSGILSIDQHLHDGPLFRCLRFGQLIRCNWSSENNAAFGYCFRFRKSFFKFYLTWGLTKRKSLLQSHLLGGRQSGLGLCQQCHCVHGSTFSRWSFCPWRTRGGLRLLDGVCRAQITRLGRLSLLVRFFYWLCFLIADWLLCSRLAWHADLDSCYVCSLFHPLLSLSGFAPMALCKGLFDIIC